MKTPHSPVFWSAPKIWDDATVFILGGGPSLLAMDLDPVHDRKVLGVNNAYLLGDWVDICWWGDSGWFDKHKHKLAEFSGLKAHCCGRTDNRPGTKRLLRGKPMGLDPRPTHVSWNNHSGASAINLALHLGAKRIVLLGFDMHFGNGGSNNWHNDHPKRKRGWNPYPKFLESFPHIKRDASTIGLEILNATPDSALTIFPMVKMEDVL